MRPVTANPATETPSQVTNDRTDNVGDERKHSRVAPKISSREEESQPLLSQPPPRTEKPGATSLKVTYFLIRAADKLGMSWAVEQLLQWDLGDVLSALDFDADNNVLRTFSAKNDKLTPLEREQISERISNVSFDRALFLTQFLHPGLNALVAAQNASGIKKLLNTIEDDKKRKFLAGAFLLRAIAQNHTTSAIALIESGAALDNSISKQTNALFFSVQRGRFEVTGKLIALARNKDENVPDDYLDSKVNGITALVLAASNGNAAAFCALLKGGADPEIAYLGNTAFQYALHNCDTRIISAYIDHKKPATKAMTMAIINDAIRPFKWSRLYAMNPGHVLEFVVRKLRLDYVPLQAEKEFIKEIFKLVLNDWELASNSNFSDAVRAVFNATSQLTQADMKQIKASFQPESSLMSPFAPPFDSGKHFAQKQHASPWAMAFASFKKRKFDEFDHIIFAQTTGVFGQKEYKPDPDEDFSTLFDKIENVCCASTSHELKAACVALPDHVISRLVDIPGHAKKLAQTLREELHSNKERGLRLVDSTGKKIDLKDEDALRRLEIQLFAFEVENILTEISNDVPPIPRTSNTAAKGEKYTRALADYERRRVASQQANDLLQGLRPAAVRAAPFQLRLVDDQLVDGLLQDAGSGKMTVTNALKKLEAAQEAAGLLPILESDAFEPLLGWAVPQFLAPSKHIAAQETKQAVR